MLLYYMNIQTVNYSQINSVAIFHILTAKNLQL